MSEAKDKKELFAVFAKAQNYDKPLILINLTFARLIDDVVLPFEEKKPFFIDGAPLKREKIRKLKILRQKDVFQTAFYDLHWGMRVRKMELQKLYGEQYHVRFEAALREGCEDVTSQVIKAFDEKIRPSLNDYLAKRPDLIDAASKFFWEGIRMLTGQQ